jgi:hypothetical protein
MLFEHLEYEISQGDIGSTRVLGEEFYPCDDVILAIGQENAFPWIERGIGIEFDKWSLPAVDKTTFQSTLPNVFFGGDAAFGPKNIIWSVEHGHQAAISMHKYCCGEPCLATHAARSHLEQPQDGHARVVVQERIQRRRAALVPHVGLIERFKKINVEVELGFTAEQAALEVQRCLNCDVQTVFAAKAVHRMRRLHRYLSGRLPHHCAERHRSGAALEAQGAGRQSEQALYVSAHCRRPDASWSRTKTSACIAACAPSAVPPPPGICKNPRSKFPSRRMRARHAESNQCAGSGERLRRQVRERQRHGLRQRQFADHEGDLSHGRPGHREELLSRRTFKGLPTWYEIRVTRDGYAARAGRVDIMVAMNAETYPKDVREVASGGYLIYDATWPRSALLQRGDITVIGVPLAKLVNENFEGVRNRILLKNIAYAGVLAGAAQCRSRGHQRPA